MLSLLEHIRNGSVSFDDPMRVVRLKQCHQSIVYALYYFNKGNETTRTKYYLDKGSYTYYYSQPEVTTKEL